MFQKATTARKEYGPVHTRGAQHGSTIDLGGRWPTAYSVLAMSVPTRVRFIIG